MTLPRPMLAAGTDTHRRCRMAAHRRRVLFGKSLWHALVNETGGGGVKFYHSAGLLKRGGAQNPKLKLSASTLRYTACHYTTAHANSCCGHQ